ncbi:MAG: hypothetical protein AAGF92_16855 [Myxococcota bacterium]
MKAAHTLVGLVVAVSALGCGDSQPEGTGNGGTGGAGSAPVDPDPLYVVASLIQGTPVSAFAGFAESLDADVEVDISDALELPNNGQAIGPNRGNVLYVVDGNVPRITRFDFDDDGSLVQGDTVSAEGMTPSSMGANPGNFVFVSEDKAYAIDTFNANVVVWNPTDMVLRGSFDIGEITEETSVGLISRNHVRRGNEIVFTLGYVRAVGYESFSKIVFLDTETDTITRIETVEGCSYAIHLFEDDNGDIYTGSVVTSVFNRLVGNPAGPECVVRIPAGQYTPTDYATFPDKTGFPNAASLAQQQGSKAYIRILDDSLVPDLSEFRPSEVNALLAWRWGLVDLATDDPPRVFTELEPRSGSIAAYYVDGTTYSSESDRSAGSARLVNLSGPDGPEPGVRVTGLVKHVFRVR